jgi:hypothetical protein
VQQHRCIGFLHSGGPFGVVVTVPAPPFLLCGGFHFSGFLILVWEGGAGFFSVFLSSLSVEFWPRRCPSPTGLCGNPC